MDSTSGPRVVAVLDSDPDTTEMLKTMLEFAGMVVATGNLNEFRLGKQDLLEFLRRTLPDVIVYDLGPPYDSNYHYLQKIREHPDFPPCGLVLTTTNARAVEALCGVQALEIFTKPYNLDLLLRSVRSATPEVPSTPPGAAGSQANHDRGHAERRHGDRRASDPSVH